LRRESARRSDEQAGAVFAALADPTRREIARLLAEQGPQTQIELAARLPITRQGVAKHLALLADAGLVEPFEAAALWMASVGAQWDRRLDALRKLLTANRAR
jgi:DNA-binding transcriptional ArsR family regulator